MAERVLDPERWSETGALLRFVSGHIHGRHIGAEVDIFRRSSASFGMIDLVLSVLVDTGDDSSARRSSTAIKHPGLLYQRTYCISSVWAIFSAILYEAEGELSVCN
jgi:hypothetical protein